MSDPDRIILEISRIELLVMKKLVLINAALVQALDEPNSKREQKAMTVAFNEIVLRADLASKVIA